MDVYLKMLACWAFLGFLAVMMMPAPRGPAGAILQGFLGGPIMWVMMVFIFLDKLLDIPDDDDDLFDN